MKRERFIELLEDQTSQLTHDELVEGWHFCPGWDGMLCMREGHECDCGPTGGTE